MEGGKPVKNRDIMILSRVLGAMQDVRHAEDASIYAQERMTAITRYMTGMPRGSGGKGGLDEAYAALEEARERYAAKLRKSLDLLDRAERILNGIEDESARCFAVMRYIYNMSAQEIRSELNLSEWGFKQACRAIEKASRMRNVRWSRRWYVDENIQGSD